ncbi:hypothetical protein C8R31_102303 [Nitrosospira sp. Nsp2]|nr:hypothetical protein C8R31_102303 [Nitrosospira sp. Nsp2]
MEEPPALSGDRYKPPFGWYALIVDYEKHVKTGRGNIPVCRGAGWCFDISLPFPCCKL